MMTTLAALLGALPLALENGTGARTAGAHRHFHRRRSVLSQFLTLYTTPVIYLYLDRFGTWIEQRRNRGRIAQAELPLQTAHEPDARPKPQLVGVGNNDRLGF